MVMNASHKKKNPRSFTVLCSDKKNWENWVITETAELKITVKLCCKALDARTKSAENSFLFLNHHNCICKM